jgi:multicomponent Na+:H+ antiporter subunit E
VRLFLLHLVIALLWMLMWGAFDLQTFIAGLVVGYALLALAGRAIGGQKYPIKLWLLVRFLAYFVKILVIANWQVAKLVLNRAMPIRPRLIRYDVAGLTPIQITTLANSITLTPGTLVVDVAPDDRFLYVHCINAPDRAQAVRELDELRDRLMTEVFA